MSDPACQTWIDVENGQGAFAQVSQVFNWKHDIWGGGSTLASYEGDKAVAAFRRLQDALKTCRSYTGTGYVGRYRAKLAPEKAPRLGDEAVRFLTTTPMPKDHRLNERDYTVVRAGSVIVTFDKLNIGARPSFPQDVIRKQVDRLTAAQRH